MILNTSLKFGLTRGKYTNMRNDSVTPPCYGMASRLFRGFTPAQKSISKKFSSGDERLGLGQVSDGAHAEHLTCTTDEI